ncbi:MAG: hypothetical protein ACM31H_06160, partial [Nitrososphaerales archaeon]
YYLTANGSGLASENPNLNGNYTVPTDFFIQFPGRYDVHTVVISVSDNVNFLQSDYGGITGGLINGIKFFVNINGVEVPLISAVSIKQNMDWFTIAPGSVLTSFSNTSQTLIAQFDIEFTFGKPLNLNAGDKFIVRLQDNFTGLVKHTFALHGILIV